MQVFKRQMTSAGPVWSSVLSNPDSCVRHGHCVVKRKTLEDLLSKRPSLDLEFSSKVGSAQTDLCDRFQAQTSSTGTQRGFPGPEFHPWMDVSKHRSWRIRVIHPRTYTTRFQGLRRPTVLADPPACKSSGADNDGGNPLRSGSQKSGSDSYRRRKRGIMSGRTRPT